MSTRKPRIEVVRTDAEQPWHVRKVAANGEIEWTSESYADKRDAEACAWRNAEPEDLSVTISVDERTKP